MPDVAVSEIASTLRVLAMTVILDSRWSLPSNVFIGGGNDVIFLSCHFDRREKSSYRNSGFSPYQVRGRLTKSGMTSVGCSISQFSTLL